MTDDDGWTPYGLEAFRQHHLKRRRLIILALAIVVAVAYIGLLQFGIDSQTSSTIETFGGGGGDTLTLEKPEEKRPTPDATLTISPGELTAPPSAIQTSGDGGGPPAPGGDRPTVEPIYWPGLLVRWGIPLGLLLVGYLVGRGRGKSEEVNYGVYKGAMPMEKISARYSHLVETTRATYQDPFGKRRPHYVPDADGGTASDGPDIAPDAANDDS